VEQGNAEHDGDWIWAQMGRVDERVLGDEVVVCDLGGFGEASRAGGKEDAAVISFERIGELKRVQVVVVPWVIRVR
jgi:hypothetical protein